MNLNSMKNLITQINCLATMLQNYQLFLMNNSSENTLKNYQSTNSESYDKKGLKKRKINPQNQQNEFEQENDLKKDQEIFYQQSSQQRVLMSCDHFCNESLYFNFPDLEVDQRPTSYPRSQKDKQNFSMVKTIDISVDKCLKAIEIGSQIRKTMLINCQYDRINKTKIKKRKQRKFQSQNIKKQ